MAAEKEQHHLELPSGAGLGLSSSLSRGPCNVRLSLIRKIPEEKVHHLLVGGLSAYRRRIIAPTPSRVYGVLWANRIDDLHFSYLFRLSAPLVPSPDHPHSAVTGACPRTSLPLSLRGLACTFCRCSPERRADVLHILNISEKIPVLLFRPGAVPRACPFFFCLPPLWSLSWSTASSVVRFLLGRKNATGYGCPGCWRNSTTDTPGLVKYLSRLGGGHNGRSSRNGLAAHKKNSSRLKVTRRWETRIRERTWSVSGRAIASGCSRWCPLKGMPVIWCGGGVWSCFFCRRDFWWLWVGLFWLKRALMFRGVLSRFIVHKH